MDTGVHAQHVSHWNGSNFRFYIDTAKFRKIIERQTVRPIKVAIVVPNSCDPDYRVVKQAEALAQTGYDVRVFCTKPHGSVLPDLEVVNGVEYARRPWGPRAAIRSLLSKVFPFARHERRT